MYHELPDLSERTQWSHRDIPEVNRYQSALPRTYKRRQLFSYKEHCLVQSADIRFLLRAESSEGSQKFPVSGRIFQESRDLSEHLPVLVSPPSPSCEVFFHPRFRLSRSRTLTSDLTELP